MMRRAVAAFLIWSDRHPGWCAAIAIGIMLVVFAMEEIPNVH